MYRLILITLLSLITLSVNAQSDRPAMVQIPRTETPPVLDADLDEPVWQQAAVFTAFKTIKPDYDLPPSEETVFYLTYDQEFVYAGFVCTDQDPERIKYTVAKRDGCGEDDWVAFCLDTFNDELGAYVFGMNPVGVPLDGMLNANADADVTPDLVWYGEGKMTETGYIVEMAIPFKSLRFPEMDVNRMGFKVARNISRKSEEVDYPVYRPERGAALSQFQKVSFSGLKSKRLIEMIPATTVARQQRHSSGVMQGDPADKNMSLTGKLGLTSDLVVEGTYNPDFSHVETDAGQIDINLRAAPFYPEKRPFFMEGQERYAFGASLEKTPLGAVVHTRNIVQPSLGLKLTGKLGGKNNIISGIFAQDTYPGSATAGNIALAGKHANVTVLRYMRRLNQDSYLGGFYTGRELSGSDNYLVGGDGRLRLTGKSYFEFHGFASTSRNQGIAGRKNGSALGGLYVYNARTLYMRAGMYDVSQHFQTDVGYLNRAGVTVAPMYARYTWFPSSWMQRVEPYYWARHARDRNSGMYESFNAIGLQISMPRQTNIKVSGRLANEIFAGQRFSRNSLRVEAGTQILNQVRLRGNALHGKGIFYDPANAFQGYGTEVSLGILLQPAGTFRSGFDLTYADFYREDSGSKVYDVTILRNTTVLQLNNNLFLRGITEYNTFRKRINADFLLSFTYIPGTVLYLGYGSVYEKLQWQNQEYRPADGFMQTGRNLFFKASYLFRL